MTQENLTDLNDKLIGRPIQCNKKTLGLRKGKKHAQVNFIGDCHLGSPECDEEKLRHQLEWCYENDVYVYLMGDLVEASHRGSVGAGVYEQAKTRYGTIQDQHEAVVDMFAPLARKELILGYLSGNHEDRVYNMTGVDIGKAFCRELDVPYLGTAGWNYWMVGNYGYRIYTLHGSSGSKFTHTKLKAITDISHSFDCDLIAMGHVHDCANSVQLVQYYDKQQKKIMERKKHLLITGHYLRYMGYAKTKGMPVTELGSPKVRFSSDEHDIHIAW